MDNGSPEDTPPCGEFSGPEAADLAGISYRQLDYWARRKWVVPSRVASEGVQRRMYSVADIVRLAALGHLGRSRIDVATYGEATGRLRVSEGLGSLIVWSIHDEGVQLTSAKDLRRVACQPGRYVIFDPAPLLRELGRRSAEARDARPRRRTFTAEYKLRVLSEYERLTEPGTKGALLRREGLHTSHLVAWRRGRETGELRERTHPARRQAIVGRPGTAQPVATRPAAVPAERRAGSNGSAVASSAVTRPA